MNIKKSVNLSIFAGVFSMLLQSMSLQAQVTEGVVDEAGLMTYSIAENIIEENIVFGEDTIDFSTLSVDEPMTLDINLAGMSVYVDYSAMEDIDESSVVYKSLDPEIAYAWEGRILAMSKGTTDIILSVNDEEYIINVTVKKDFSEELQKALEVASNKNTMARISSERQAIVDKGREMASLLWTPTSNLRGWKNEMTFIAGKTYSGIPYSQTQVKQTDDLEFLECLKKDDFYDDYVSDGVVMPKYGSDCSGFVSFAWGLSRQTTAEFIKNASIGGYENLEPGDAVVYRKKVGDEYKGHVMLVSMNYSDASEPYVVCYEQTTYKATISINKYSSLTSNGYKAISKFS